MALPLTYNLRNLYVRRRSVGLTVAALALIVAAFAGLLGFAGGIRRVFDVTGSPTKIVVLKLGSTSETGSAVGLDDLNKLTAIDLLARDERGRPLLSPEVMVQASLRRRGSGDEASANVAVRGVDDMAFAVHDEIKLIEGRRFNPAEYEVIVGRAASQRFEGLTVGSEIPIGYAGDKLFTVVGVFSANGGVRESEIWGYRSTILDVQKRTMVSSVICRLARPEDMKAAVDLIQGPTIQLTAKSERAYYQELNESSKWILRLAMLLVVVMGLAACGAVAITMHALVAGRTREIAMLKAIGFSGGSVLAAFLIEACILSLAAGAIGCLISLLFDGMSRDMLNNSFTTVAFRVRLTPAIWGLSMLTAVVIGLLGAFQPAWRAGRLRVIDVLREG